MGDGVSTTRNATPEYRKLAAVVELLVKSGIPESALKAMLEEKILTDLSQERDKRLCPSLN